MSDARPNVTASAEEIAALVREYFAWERAITVTGTSKREMARRRGRMNHVRADLVRAVDFDASANPFMSWQVRREKIEAREAARLAAKAAP